MFARGGSSNLLGGGDLKGTYPTDASVTLKVKLDGLDTYAVVVAVGATVEVTVENPTVNHEQDCTATASVTGLRGNTLVTPTRAELA